MTDESHTYHDASGRLRTPYASPRRREHTKYKPDIVTAYFNAQGIPAPDFEHAFHPVRKWRFDIAWPVKRVYLEVDGGIWIAGGHNRGAQILKDWEKRNAATALGWRGLWCQPKDLCTEAMAETIRRALQ